MALDLHKGARPDERFHLQKGAPVPAVSRSWLTKTVRWANIFVDDKGTPGTFVSWWILGNALHWYKGNVKCDASRTYAYWAGQLDDGQGQPYTPDPELYVMTTTEKEKLSVRFFVDPADPNWTSMGGA